jgi:predicted RNase H-like HicB family nuclease
MTKGMRRLLKSKERSVVSQGSSKMTTVAEYLKKPYGRLLIPEDEGGYHAEIIEFPGCFADGETAGEAAANLEEAASSWLAAVIAKGQAIPEPMEELDYSGKLVVRLPKSLHKHAALAANREGVSLNQFIVSSIAEQVGGYRWSVFNYTRLSVMFTVHIDTSGSKGGWFSQNFTPAAAPMFLPVPLQAIENA